MKNFIHYAKEIENMDLFSIKQSEMYSMTYSSKPSIDFSRLVFQRTSTSKMNRLMQSLVTWLSNEDETLCNSWNQWSFEANKRR